MYFKDGTDETNLPECGFGRSVREDFSVVMNSVLKKFKTGKVNDGI